MAFHVASCCKYDGSMAPTDAHAAAGVLPCLRSAGGDESIAGAGDGGDGGGGNIRTWFSSLWGAAGAFAADTRTPDRCAHASLSPHGDGDEDGAVGQSPKSQQLQVAKDAQEHYSLSELRQRRGTGSGQASQFNF